MHRLVSTLNSEWRLAALPAVYRSSLPPARSVSRSASAFAPATMALSKVGTSRVAGVEMAQRKPFKKAAKKVAKKSSGKSAQEGKGGIFPWVTNTPGSKCSARKSDSPS